MYEYIGEKEHFRSLAYFKASRMIDSLSDDLSDFMKNHSLEELPGIGKGIANRIKEYISTGHIKVYDNLKTLKNVMKLKNTKKGQVTT